MNNIDPLSFKDPSINTLINDKIHTTKTALSINNTTGVFVDDDQIIISAGNNQIIINENNIMLMGHVMQQDMIETTGMTMTNPTGVIPGTIIPQTIIASFQKLPDPGMLMPFINIGIDMATIMTSLL